MPAWLQAVDAGLVAQAAAGPALPPRLAGARMPGLATDILPPARHVDLTLLLAGLVLSTVRPARRIPSATPTGEGASR
jgi:hypothetical protein